MSKTKLEGVLYSYILRQVRNALDLECAIRASEVVSAEEMKALRKLDESIHDFWSELGASREEISEESLVDFAWDTLQVGFPLSRRHSRVFHPELLRIINLGLSQIRDRYSAQMQVLAIPAARFYRICDLLNGNDIEKAIDQVKQGRAAASKYTSKDDVPPSEVRLQLREPIHLHPDFRFGIREEDGKTVFGFEVDLAGEFDLFQWKRQLNEFQYQYALYRGTAALKIDRVASDLIQDFLEREHEGEQSEFDIPGVDSLLTILVGLYCWDRYKRDGVTLAIALAEAVTITGRGEQNMRRSYRRAAKHIEAMVARFIRSRP